MPLWLIILLIAVAVIAIFLIFTYNALVRLRNMVDEAWNQISVQLKRRHDLIPNLVNAVKGYMDFEQETLTRVIEARNQAVTAQQAGPTNAGQAAQAENFLTGALRQHTINLKPLSPQAYEALRSAFDSRAGHLLEVQVEENSEGE